jgi:acetyltransferase
MKTAHLPPAIDPHAAPCFGGHPDGLHLERIIKVRGQGKFRMRPIQLDDEEDMIHFHKHVSEESVYMRYFQYMGLDQRTTHERLISICTNTPASYAIVIERITRDHFHPNIVAVGRLTKTLRLFIAAFDILLIEEERTPQLAKILIQQLIDLARGFGFLVLQGEMLMADHFTLDVCQGLEFQRMMADEDGLVSVSRDL